MTVFGATLQRIPVVERIIEGSWRRWIPFRPSLLPTRLASSSILLLAADHAPRQTGPLFRACAPFCVPPWPRGGAPALPNERTRIKKHLGLERRQRYRGAGLRIESRHRGVTDKMLVHRCDAIVPFRVTLSVNDDGYMPGEALGDPIRKRQWRAAVHVAGNEQRRDA